MEHCNKLEPNAFLPASLTVTAGRSAMLDDQEKRRLLEEETKSSRKREAEKPSFALSASWWVAGVLILGLIIISAL